MGRHSEYNDEIGVEICRVVSNSTKMLEDLCDEHENWPSANAIYEWRIRHPHFGEMYAKAKQCQIEPLVSSILTKVRDHSKDYYEPEPGKKAVNTAHTARLKMEVDAIKWLAGKLSPRLYGEKLEKAPDTDTKTLLQHLIDKL